MTRRPRWAYLAILLLTCTLRFWNLGGPSLWYDEAYTWWVATQVTPAESLASSIHEIIPPGSYFLWRIWAALTGETEFALRAAAALLGILTVATAGRVIWRLTQQSGGVMAALVLFTLAPPLLWASREVRMYGPLLAFTLLADMALLEVLFGPHAQQRQWTWLWGACTLLSLYTLVLAGFWLTGQGLFVLITLLSKTRRSINAKGQGTKQRVLTLLAPVRELWLPALTTAALYLPWLVAAWPSLQSNRGYWAGYLPPKAFFRTTFQGITVFEFLSDDLALFTAAWVLILTTLSLLLTTHIPLAGLYTLSYALPGLTLLSYIYRTIPKWGLRHSVLFAPAPYLALAAAWGAVPHIRKLRWRRICLGALVTISTAVSFPLWLASANLLSNPAFAREDWRGAAQYVTAHRQPQDLVIIETGSVFPTWVYYAGDQKLLPLPHDPLLDVRHVLHYENTAPVLNAALTHAPNIWLVRWLAEVTDPTDIVPTLLGDIGQMTPVPTFHGLDLQHFVLDTAPDFPPTPPATATPNAELLPDLHLWGYTVPNTLPADEELHARTWWTTDNPHTHDGKFYQVSLRLMDGNGYVWKRIDAPPGGGDYRPERWPIHTPILGTLDMPLPPGIPAGHYTLKLILYTEEMTGDYVLGTLRITRPQTPPEVPDMMTRVPPAANETPLSLLAVGTKRARLQPCQEMRGQLFWEVRQPLTTPYEACVELGKEKSIQPLTPDFSPEDWQVGDRFLSQFQLPIGCLAPDGTSLLRIALKSPLSEASIATWTGPEITLDFGRKFEPPDTMTHVEAQIGPDIATLIGYRLEPERIVATQPLTLTLYWRAEQTSPTPYTAFVHITPPDAPGPVIAQHDSWPARGERPTYTWLTGEIIADPHPLPGIAAGQYRLRVGLYGPDGTRLPIIHGGVSAPDAPYPLTQLDVKEK